jgi:hypothetical protein
MGSGREIIRIMAMTFLNEKKTFKINIYAADAESII